MDDIDKVNLTFVEMKRFMKVEDEHFWYNFITSLIIVR